MTTIEPYRPLPPLDDGVRYEHGPLSVPGRHRAGEVSTFEVTDPAAFPGTTRRVWVHTPAGHDSTVPAAVMVFNDGWWYLDPDGDVRGGIVLDNLAGDGLLSSTVGVFVDPGTFPDAEDPKNRNHEYDAETGDYADFLAQEVLPRVAEMHRLTDDPAQRGICGGSSGGNAAFTAAWQRPDVFGKVIAYNASFAQMPQGNPYPQLLAEHAQRPLRVLLHAAQRDLGWDQREMNWFAENLETAAALARAGYDARLVVGDGPHSPNHGGVLLPDALSWLWRQ